MIVKRRQFDSRDTLTQLSISFAEISEESNLPENSIFIQEKNMEPVIRWIKAEIPEAPKEEFTQVRVTHIDENGQIVSFYHFSVLDEIF